MHPGSFNTQIFSQIFRRQQKIEILYITEEMGANGREKEGRRVRERGGGGRREIEQGKGVGGDGGDGEAGEEICKEKIEVRDEEKKIQHV